jgi:hypothetical protein
VADWLHYFDQHAAQRFVSDGDPETVAVPKGRRGEVRPRPGQVLQVIEAD